MREKPLAMCFAACLTIQALRNCSLMQVDSSG